MEEGPPQHAEWQTSSCAHSGATDLCDGSGNGRSDPNDGCSVVELEAVLPRAPAPCAPRACAAPVSTIPSPPPEPKAPASPKGRRLPVARPLVRLCRGQARLGSRRARRRPSGCAGRLRRGLLGCCRGGGLCRRALRLWALGCWLLRLGCCPCCRRLCCPCLGALRGCAHSGWCLHRHTPGMPEERHRGAEGAHKAEAQGPRTHKCIPQVYAQI